MPSRSAGTRWLDYPGEEDLAFIKRLVLLIGRLRTMRAHDLLR